MSSSGLAGRTETFVRYGFTERFEAGFGYLWKQGVVRPLASYTAVTETERRPSLSAGMMFDSLGDGREGFFLAAAKGFGAGTSHPGSVYLGGAHITNESGLRFIAGVNVGVARRLTASLQYDGKFFHPGLMLGVGEVAGAPVQLGVVAARGDRFGPLIAVSAPLGR